MVFRQLSHTPLYLTFLLLLSRNHSMLHDWYFSYDPPFALNALPVRSQAPNNGPWEQGEQAGGGRISAQQTLPMSHCLLFCSVLHQWPISEDLTLVPALSYFLRQIYSFGVLLCVVLTYLKDVKEPHPPQWGCRPNPLLLIFGQRSREGALQKDVTVRSLRDGQMGQILVINLSGVVDSSYSATDRRWSLGE